MAPTALGMAVSRSSSSAKVWSARWSALRSRGSFRPLRRSAWRFARRS